MHLLDGADDPSFGSIAVPRRLEQGRIRLSHEVQGSRALRSWSRMNGSERSLGLDLDVPCLGGLNKPGRLVEVLEDGVRK